MEKRGKREGWGIKGGEGKEEERKRKMKETERHVSSFL